MERAREYNQDIILCFIDYSKAFDSVDHAVLWNVLRDVGLPEHLITLLHSLYMDQEATVGETKPFTVEKGVRQGCNLSSVLFNIYAEHIMREAGMDEAEEGAPLALLVLPVVLSCKALYPMAMLEAPIVLV